MYEYWIKLALTNFSLSMLILAFIIILLNALVKRAKTPSSEVIYRWITLLPLGVTGVFAFVMHAIYPNMAAATIGWQTSPFQFEVAIADLGFGILGILAFYPCYGFRLASVIGAIIWLWGDAAGHIYQMIIHHNYSVGNAGSWFWLDLIIPIILIFCIIKLRTRSVEAKTPSL